MRRHRFYLFVLFLAACGRFGRGLSPIRLESIVTLGATTGDGAIATSPVVSALHPGGFRIVTPAYSAITTLPMVFASSGEYLGNLHGDSTQMGSFSGPTFTRFGPGDSIWVFDNTGRVLVFSPQRRYIRTVVLPNNPGDAEILRDGRIIASGDSGVLVVLYDARGLTLRGIGATHEDARWIQYNRSILPDTGATFWTMQRKPTWIVQHWDTLGKLLHTLKPRLDWLGPDNAPEYDFEHVYDRPPVADVSAAWLDHDRHLWIVGEVADRHWINGLAPRDTASKRTFPLDDFDKYLDTIIEVLDIPTGRVIASTTFDRYYAVTGEAGVLAHVTRTSAGWQRAELVRVVVDAPTSRP